MLRGRDIKRYGYEYADLWLLYIPWHFPLHNDPTITGASEKAEAQFMISYPAIYNHLLGYKNDLSNRNKAETGVRYEWYALQRWGANYSEDFFRPKIIFQEMVQKPSFMIDESNHFMCLDTGRIIVGENLKYLLAVLNSKLFFYAIKSFYGGGALGESGVRMKHTFFENFNCVIPSFKQKKILEMLVNQRIILKENSFSIEEIEKEIDKLIYSLYDINSQEMIIIEG